MPIVRERNRPIMITTEEVDYVASIGLDDLGLYVWLVRHGDGKPEETLEGLAATLGLEDEEIQRLLDRLERHGLITFEADRIFIGATPQETSQGRSDTPESPPSPDQYNPGYVYVVYGEGYYKIGLTQSPKHRMKALQSSVPFPLTCVYLISTVFMWQTEALLHTTFAAKRIKGEWFALAEGDLAWIRLTFPPAGDPHATASL